MIMVILLMLNILSSCKKFLEIPPPAASITENNAFTIDAAAIGVMTGIYTSMVANGPFTGNSQLNETFFKRIKFALAE